MAPDRQHDVRIACLRRRAVANQHRRAATTYLRWDDHRDNVIYPQWIGHVAASTSDVPRSRPAASAANSGPVCSITITGAITAVDSQPGALGSGATGRSAPENSVAGQRRSPRGRRRDPKGNGICRERPASPNRRRHQQQHRRFFVGRGRQSMNGFTRTGHQPRHQRCDRNRRPPIRRLGRCLPGATPAHRACARHRCRLPLQRQGCR